MSGCYVAEGSFTRGLRREPALAFPQPTAAVAAFNAAKLSAYFSRLRAAFRSRSHSKPQSSNLKVRSFKSSVSLTTPQQEQVLLEGNQRSAITIVEPYSLDL